MSLLRSPLLLACAALAFWDASATVLGIALLFGGEPVSFVIGMLSGSCLAAYLVLAFTFGDLRVRRLRILSLVLVPCILAVDAYTTVAVHAAIVPNVPIQMQPEGVKENIAALSQTEALVVWLGSAAAVAGTMALSYGMRPLIRAKTVAVR